MRALFSLLAALKVLWSSSSALDIATNLYQPIAVEGVNWAVRISEVYGNFKLSMRTMKQC